jgi:nitrate/TMAO reductase-like tetraheme cytochrome c subunit
MKIFQGKTLSRLFDVVRKYWVGFLAGLLFSILCFIAINAAAGHFSTSEYCGGKCHEMAAAYRSWELSPHYANDSGVVAECIDCHLPPKDNFFTHMTTKAYVGVKDIYKHHFGGEYDSQRMVKKVLEKTPNSRCLACHRSLLVKPSSSSARIAHQAVLNPAEDSRPRCVECHKQLHERDKTIFSPD